MDLRDTPEEAAFRGELRGWLDESLPDGLQGHRGGATRFEGPEMREWSRALYEAGYVGLTWPEEYGGGGQEQEPDENDDLGRKRARVVLHRHVGELTRRIRMTAGRDGSAGDVVGRRRVRAQILRQLVDRCLVALGRVPGSERSPGPVVENGLRTCGSCGRARPAADERHGDGGAGERYQATAKRWPRPHLPYVPPSGHPLPFPTDLRPS